MFDLPTTTIEGSFAESKSRRIIIEDAEAEAVHIFIRFLYTDMLDPSVDTHPRLAHQVGSFQDG